MISDTPESLNRVIVISDKPGVLTWTIVISEAPGVLGWIIMISGTQGALSWTLRKILTVVLKGSKITQVIRSFYICL